MLSCKSSAIIFSISLISSLNICFSQNDNLQNAEDAITHATTYHWLARYKNNDARDLLKSKEYFTEALTYLHEDDTTQNTKALRDKASAGLLDTDVRYENCYDNVNNEYPLFNVICGYDKTYELYDDPDVVAANYAIEDAIAVIPLPIKNDFQYDVIVISEPKNYELEDEIRVALNSHPQFFPRPIEDILDVISKDEYNDLYNHNFSEKILDKLSHKWNKDDLLIAKIIKNDQINDVSYLGIYLYEWNKNSNAIIRSVYADGLAEDRRNYNENRLIWLISLLLLAVFSPIISKYTFLFKEEKDRRPVYFWTGIYSFLLSIILIYGLIFIMRPLAPSPTALAILPYAGLWIFCLPPIIVFIPLLIIYFITILTPKINERLHDSETIASLIGGITLGILFIFSSFHFMEFPEVSQFHFIISTIIIAFFFSIWVGHHLSDFFIHNKRFSIFPLISLCCILILIIFSFITANSEILYIADLSILLIPAFYHGYNKYAFYNKLKKKTELGEIGSGDFTLQKLQILINEPPIFIDPSPMGDFISNKISHFSDSFNANEDSNLKVILITGPQGFGKTRLAKELAIATIDKYNKINSIQENGNKNWILFGDCDELNQSGSGVPFEPFSQALHEILGAGRFEPPAKKANKIKEGISATGLGDILDIGGIGVLNMILGTQDEEITPATTSEMVQIINQTLIGLSKDTPVVFIIDDLHWIDPITNTLFENLLKKLSTEHHSNIFFIFTSRSETKKVKNNGIDPVKFLRDSDNDGTIDLIEITDLEIDYRDRFDELLTRSLHFDRHSAQKYLTFINSYEVNSILTVLQFIKSIINQDGIDLINNKVKIDRKFDFTKLRPPTDIINVIDQQLQLLSESQLKIIKFASFIGHEFRATILSEALKLGRLQVLYDLEFLEEKDIIVDIRSQDDVYEFKSNALINVVRYMANISENDQDEIPQIVREYHFRVANSIQEKMKIENRKLSSISNQDLFTLAKRSWAAGDRMLSDAFDYNVEALSRAFKQYRYEEAIIFGKNIIEIDEKFEHEKNLEDIIRVYLLIAQSRIILGLEANSIDEVIENAKLCVEKSEDPNKELWKLVILNVEADALIHDHSGYFEKQRVEILNQINTIINKSVLVSKFEIKFTELSQIRLNKNLENSSKNKMLVTLLENVRNTKLDVKELTETPLSGFSNNPEIDYKILESEILEELIHIMLINESNPLEIITYLQECEKIKLSKEVNDKEGLALVYYYFGKCYEKLNNIEKADYYFNETVHIGKRIGSDYWESRGIVCLGNILLKKEEHNSALTNYLSAQTLNISGDKEILYQIYIGIINISNKTNNETLRNEYIQDANMLMQEDDLKGYLYEDLRALTSK